MSYHGKLQTLKNGTADAEIQQWAHNELTIAEINFENAERIIKEEQSKLQAATQVIKMIANEQVELSHDKIKWQNGDHIRWCKEYLKKVNDGN